MIGKSNLCENETTSRDFMAAKVAKSLHFQPQVVATLARALQNLSIGKPEVGSSDSQIETRL